MDINTNVYRQAEVRAQPAASAPVARNIQRESSPNVSANVMPRHQLINAMNLMQTASGIIQEALTASSRLRSLALSTIYDGSTSFSEVASTISGIQTSLQQYGQTILPPVLREVKSEPVDIRNVAGDIELLGTMAREKKIDPELLDRAEKRFQSVQSDIDERFSAAEKKMGVVTKNTPPVSEVARSIPASPQQALSAQGNLSQESVSALLR